MEAIWESKFNTNAKVSFQSFKKFTFLSKCQIRDPWRFQMCDVGPVLKIQCEFTTLLVAL